MRGPVARFGHAQRQPRFGGLAVDQKGLAGRDDMAEYSDSALQLAADHTGWQIRSRGNLELVLGTVDHQCNRSAFCIEALDDMGKNILPHTQRVSAVGRGLAEFVQCADPRKIGGLAASQGHDGFVHGESGSATLPPPRVCELDIGSRCSGAKKRNCMRVSVTPRAAHRRLRSSGRG